MRPVINVTKRNRVFGTAGFGPSDDKRVNLPTMLGGMV